VTGIIGGAELFLGRKPDVCELRRDDEPWRMSRFTASAPWCPSSRRSLHKSGFRKQKKLGFAERFSSDQVYCVRPMASIIAA
jgi:hypothetical protein